VGKKVLGLHHSLQQSKKRGKGGEAVVTIFNPCEGGKPEGPGGGKGGGGQVRWDGDTGGRKVRRMGMLRTRGGENSRHLRPKESHRGLGGKVDIKGEPQAL